MTVRKTMLAAGLAALMMAPAPARAQNDRGASGVQGVKPIRTLQNIRDEGVSRQRWDMSCGAAALSTVLTYYYKDNTPETAIVVWLLHRLNPAMVRKRGGFSLLDLKRFSDARGYSADGYSEMTIADLAAEKAWVITPIRQKGFNHFVVVKGIELNEDRVFIGDPGFGNITMTVSQFQKLWKDGIAFIVRPPDERMVSVNNKTAVASQLVPDETIIVRDIANQVPANNLY